MQGDGDGWIECQLGHRHWGRFGAAGLLLHTSHDGKGLVLLQLRADWCHHGGTWGIPGGARDSHESAEQAALREAHEEAGIQTQGVVIHREVVDDHGGWTYTTVVASVEEPIDTEPNHETAAMAWQPIGATGSLTLHPGFGATWPDLHVGPLHVVVDTANVVGSRPDGWWRDRAGATTRQLTRLSRLISRLVTLPSGQDAVVVTMTAILEGQARTASTTGGIQTLLANGAGDDAVVAFAELHPDRTTLVVTADAGLIARLPADVQVAGPSWLRRWLND